MANCIEQGMVTCWDGSCQSTYANCPEVSEGEEGSYVSGGDFGAYENPWDDQDALLGWIYENMGGQDYFDMSEQEFSSTYGDEWMEYNPSQAELIYDQLGLLDWAEDVRDDEFEINRDKLDLKDKSLLHSLNLARTGAGNDLYTTVMQLEGVTRAGRGARSGQVKKRSAKVFSNIEDDYTATEAATKLDKEAIILDRESLDNAYDQSLIDFESRELNLIQDVEALEDRFMDNLWDQINQRLASEVYMGEDNDYDPPECSNDSDCSNGYCDGGNCSQWPDNDPDGTGVDVSDNVIDAEDEGASTVNASACAAAGGEMIPDPNLPYGAACVGGDSSQYEQILDDYNDCTGTWNWDTQSCSDATPPAGDTGYCPCGYDDNDECNPYTGTPVGSGYSWDISDVTCL